MLISDGNKVSQISSCLEAAAAFQLTRKEAVGIARCQQAVIQDNWNTVCDEAQVSEIDRAMFWGRQFLNTYSCIGLD
jgi:serine/threonine-protein kinase HipA